MVANRPHRRTRLQIQILLVLFLLRLSTRLPLTSSSSWTRGQEARGEASPQRVPFASTLPDVHGESASKGGATKRKRKAEHAKRWTGNGKGVPGFPWNLHRDNSREGQLSTAERGEDEEGDNRCTDAESLSRRFDTLLDSLCLQVLTRNLDFDFEPASSSIEQSPSAPSKTVFMESANHIQPWQMFGSEGRRRQKSREDRDVLQWLCCHIIEPQFSTSLPRQCGIIRGKCFVPGSGSTPAKTSIKQEREKRHAKPPGIGATDSAQRQRGRDEGHGKEQEKSRRALFRSQTQSPAPVPWSLLREEEEEGWKQSQSAVINRWDARQVSVRRKWDRSQSIGIVSHNSSSTDSLSVNKQTTGRGSSVQPVEALQAPQNSRRESQTLVVATPSKGQASNARSSSFSSQPHLTAARTAAAASLAFWRRTESQPVEAVGRGKLMVKEESWSEEEEEEEDVAADEMVAGPLFINDSDNDDVGHEWPGRCASASQSQTRPAAQSKGKVALLQETRSELARTTSLPVALPANAEDEDDEKGELVLTKRKRVLPPSTSFAFMDPNAPARSSKNPFAVAN